MPSVLGSYSRNSIAWDPDPVGSQGHWYFTEAAQSRINSSFPRCQHKQWCDDEYALEDTKDVQEAIFKHQNPDDCSTARLMIKSSQWPAGVGSTLAIHAFFLAMAISDNRVLVVPPGQGWTYTSCGLCSCKSGLPSVNHTESGEAGCPANADCLSNSNCFFIPTTKCQMPETMGGVGQWKLGDKARVVQQTGNSELFDIDNCEISVQSPIPGLARYREKMSSWWQAQMFKYLLRPRRSLMRQIIAPLQASAFYRNNGIIPRPLASVFIRAGDKSMEVAQKSAEEYYKVLKPIAEKLGAKDVYVGSDDPNQIHRFIELYGKEFNIHWIDYFRPVKGFTFNEVSGWSGTYKMDQLMRLVLADLFITVQADVMVGSHQSNWCRLSDGLRRANGKVRVPYGTTTDELMYSMCENTGKNLHLHLERFERMKKIVREGTVGSYARRTDRT